MINEKVNFTVLLLNQFKGIFTYILLPTQKIVFILQNREPWVKDCRLLKWSEIRDICSITITSFHIFIRRIVRFIGHLY